MHEIISENFKVVIFLWMVLNVEVYFIKEVLFSIIDQIGINFLMFLLKSSNGFNMWCLTRNFLSFYIMNAMCVWKFENEYF